MTTEGILKESINPTLQKLGLSELIPELELELNKQQEKNNPLDYKSWQLTKSQKLEIQKQSKEIAKKHAEKGDNKKNINDFELEQK